MTDIQRELLAAFDAEHREHLDAVRTALSRAAAGGAIDLREVFRRAHSLKGAARAVDMAPVEAIAHALEDLIARVTDGKASLDEPTIGALTEALDLTEALVAAVIHGAPPPDAARIAGIQARLAGGNAPKETIPVPPAVAPEAEPVRDEPLPDYVRVTADGLDALARTVSGIMADVEAQAVLTRRLRALEAEVREIRRGLSSGRGDATARLRDVDQRLRTAARSLSNLVRDQRRQGFALEQSARRARNAVGRLGHVAAETVFGGFGAMVREIAREEGVEVDYRTEGLDLPVDRGVLQALKDPVTHILRNAIGHGAEPAQARTARGRPAAMTLTLSAAIRAGRLQIRVRDDGRGPDLRRIEQVALERGLLPPRHPGQPPTAADRLLALVFEPGFSTAGTVDRLSGRGVGLSVVAEAVKARRGSVHLGQAWPHGTDVEIQVPLGTVLQSVLVVEAGGVSYGLPTYGVERLLRLPTEGLTSVSGRPAAWIEIGGRDVIVPIVTLSELLGGSSVSLPVEAGHAKVAVLRRGARRCAVAVEAFHEARPMLVEAIDGFGADRRLVTGAVLLEGETPAPVLDPEGLVDRWIERDSERSGGTLGLPDWRPQVETKPATILVVDDSITTRTLEKSILEAQGYRVLLSVDGIDALQVLRSGDAIVDLVIADVEMPRMDGFALLAAIRNDARLAPLPVIMMTSRAAPEDVRRGLDLGADAYVTKQKFDQRELLATIGQLL
ncbi:hybrid sensor histidine kinase/response regulator [Chthonobacter albigriseus]|uniref:hybrid sensor histidine kinase/response regulator n=1 Tax=Chthonobacter albigriseus TaxID=1683161 RepID=UPI0015EEEB98|nr:response regulator [Chthonobacter albigriseus]